MLTIPAISVPFSNYLTYGVKSDGTLAFVYAHDTERGAQMKTSRIGNGNDKHWKPQDLKSWGFVEVQDKYHTEGVKVW